MNKLFTLFILCLLANTVFSQDEMPTDTTIYIVSDQAPRFPGCEKLDTTQAVIYECAQRNLLRFVYDNVRYPYDAREKNLSGTVVASFIVEKDGTISDAKVIKDIGGGCGEEVLRIVNAMNEVFIRWRPAMKAGVPVRTRFNLPVKFRLEEALDYVMVGRDSVYTILDKNVVFTEGEEALNTFVNVSIKAPMVYQDSCYIGNMDVSLLVNPDNSVKVINVNDYNNLGYDFQFEAILMANSTLGKWTPGVRKERNVPTLTDIAILFKSENASCQTLFSDFEKAEQLANKGSELYNAGNLVEGLEKLTQAIDMFPDNTNFRYLRGQAYMAENDFEKACEDYTIVRNILTTSPVNDIYSILCK
ncbi:MAG: TonB family protein [Saprospiraceae bacterium]|jgi:TonB family protein